MNDINVEIVSRPAVSPAYFVSALSRAIADYAKAHADLFETVEFREWQERYRKQKEVVSCRSGTTSQDTP